GGRPRARGPALLSRLTGRRQSAFEELKQRFGGFSRKPAHVTSDQIERTRTQSAMKTCDPIHQHGRKPGRFQSGALLSLRDFLKGDRFAARLSDGLSDFRLANRSGPGRVISNARMTWRGQ